MGSGDIVVSETSKKGVRSLKAFLEYCETGHLHHAQHTGQAAESDFEVAVVRALNEQGYECEPQLGVAGYFLDVAVKDPGQPGRFLMGIECDGATYHSAKSTRDRDRLRQDILEGLKWKIRRIWSTDWFKNPQAQLQPILEELNDLKTPSSLASADVEDLTQAVKDQEVPRSLAGLGNIESNDRSNDSGTENVYQPTLEERIDQLNETVIRIELPDTNEEKRLLRPAMIEALLQHQPCSKAEFLEYIPAYLRTGTAPEEGRYIDQVVKLIADFG